MAEAIETPEPLARLLTASEVGQLLHRHEETVKRLVKTGELTAVRLGAKTLRFAVPDIESYINKHRTDRAEPTTNDAARAGTAKARVAKRSRRRRIETES